MKRWFRVLHNLGLHLADTRWGTLILFIFAFCDASFILLPASTLLLLLIAFNARRAREYIISATIGTLAGAFIAYIIGHFAWFAPDGGYTGFVQFLFNHLPGFTESTYNKIHNLYSKWGFWLLCAATATPLPYGVLSVFSGVFSINVFIFLLATVISQGLKFTILTLVSINSVLLLRKLNSLKGNLVNVIISFYYTLAIKVNNRYLAVVAMMRPQKKQLQ